MEAPIPASGSSRSKRSLGPSGFIWDGRQLSEKALAEVNEAIELAEARSACTCEECGAEGRLYDSGGWYLTRCPRHSSVSRSRSSRDGKFRVVRTVGGGKSASCRAAVTTASATSSSRRRCRPISTTSPDTARQFRLIPEARVPESKQMNERDRRFRQFSPHGPRPSAAAAARRSRRGHEEFQFRRRHADGCGFRTAATESVAHTAAPADERRRGGGNRRAESGAAGRTARHVRTRSGHDARH